MTQCVEGCTQARVIHMHSNEHTSTHTLLFVFIFVCRMCVQLLFRDSSICSLVIDYKTCTLYTCLRSHKSGVADTEVLLPRLVKFMAKRLQQSNKSLRTVKLHGTRTDARVSVQCESNCTFGGSIMHPYLRSPNIWLQVPRCPRRWPST